MNRYTWIVTTVMTAALAVVGCSKSEQPEAPQVKETIQAPSAPAPMAAPTQPAPKLEEATKSLQETTYQAAGEFGNVLHAFQSADASTQSSIERAVTAMKSGNYAEALPILQKQLAEAKLTPEQQSLLKDLIATAQKEMVGRTVEQAVASPETAVSGVEKTVTDLKKSLPFGK